LPLASNVPQTHAVRMPEVDYPLDDVTLLNRDRREALLGHRGVVVWLTGLSGSGKTTIAVAAEQKLFEMGLVPIVLDGDVLRAGLCRDLGFSNADRDENVRRATEAALLMAEGGSIVIVALISPFKAHRQFVAQRCRSRGVPFAEVYVNAPLDECERRDPKGLYRRARTGEIPAFTGIASPYEAPESPMLELRTNRELVEQSVRKVAKLAVDLAQASSPPGHGI
jgi:bifunctional enzyme CysN/CysC